MPFITDDEATEIAKHKGPTLEALIRRASRKAEQIFDERGEIPMFFLCETADGEQLMMVTSVPPCGGFAEAAAVKSKIADAVRDFFREHDVRRYVQVSEAWTVPEPRVRSSSELPDDEGRVFVTLVPGAPLQVLGRRANNGELCIGRWAEIPDSETFEAFAQSTKEFASRGGEVVTGKEAEDLIAEVVCERSGSLANHPNRIEIVVLQAADDRECVVAKRGIVRPAGGKPYLEKLGPIERSKEVTGRFRDLLPRSTTVMH